MVQFVITTSHELRSPFRLKSIMSPTQPDSSNEIEVSTRDGEHLSSILYRVLGFVNAKILRDTLQRNPHLAEQPPLYPAQIVIQIAITAEQTQEIPAQTLWS